MIEVSRNRFSLSYVLRAGVCVGVAFVLLAEQQAAAQIELAADIAPGSERSFPEALTVFNGQLYFSAYDSNLDEFPSLWRFDGTSASLASSVEVGNEQYGRSMKVYNDALYFGSEGDGTPTNRGLWRFDGNNASLAKNIQAGFSNSLPRTFTVYDNMLYFSAYEATFGGVTYEGLWRSDGTNTAEAPLTQTQIYTGNDFGSYSPFGMAVFQNDLYLAGFDGIQGTELWKYNQATAESMAADIQSGAGSGLPRSFAELNGELYFQANDGTNGRELWKFDGSTASMVANIASGSAGSEPSWLTVFDDEIYFQADAGSLGRELWKFDGTAASLVADINAGVGGSVPSELIVFDGNLYFQAYDDIHGQELWMYDGTNASLVADLYPGAAGSAPGDFEIFNGSLYFRAIGANVGFELFRLPGSAVPEPGTFTLATFVLVGLGLLRRRRTNAHAWRTGSHSKQVTARAIYAVRDKGSTGTGHVGYYFDWFDRFVSAAARIPKRDDVSPFSRSCSADKVRMQKMTAKILVGIVLVGIIVVKTLVAPAQGDIVWGTPKPISGDTDVRTNGNLVYAYNLYDFPGTNPVLNGVTFVNELEWDIFGGGDITTTLNSGNAGAFGSPSPPFSTLSDGYQALLYSAAFHTVLGTQATVNLNNLTNGQRYRVQIWVNDSRANGGSRVVSLDDGPTELSPNVPGSEGGLGQFVTGVFSANGPTQSFTLQAFGNPATKLTQLNAIQLRTIPEPGTCALVCVGLACGFAGERRWRRKHARKK